MRQTLIGWVATSCFLILAVAALRATLGKRMGAGLRYALWGLVLVRLLVPVQLFTSPIVGTVIDSERIVTKQIQTEREVLGGQDGPQAGASNPSDFPAAPAMPDPPTVPDPPDWRLLPAVLGWVWLAGGGVMAAVLLGCNLSFWLRLRRTRRPVGDAGVWAAEGGGPHMSQQMPFEVGAAPLGGPACNMPASIPHDGDCLSVYMAQGLPSPCLFGVFRPAIYVAPETADDPAALRHVLAHESTHFRHGDHIWSLLRCAALCVHWWNPLVWLAAKLSRRDGELACDEGALKRLGDGERVAYGNTLLALVAGKAAPGGPLICSTAMTGDKKSLKERFARIARAPRRAAGIGLAAIILAALVTVCAFGQRTSTPASWAELSADLSLTIDDDGTVRITGTVDGMELPRGAFWYPDSLFSGSPYGELSLVYPDFSDGIEGQLSACWADEGHTAVNLSTRMMATLSSLSKAGYWEFTVDFSDGGAKVTRMEESVIRDDPNGTEVRLYPKTIDQEKAVRAGRIAARLLTAAEQCWEEHKGKEAFVYVETAFRYTGNDPLSGFAVPGYALDAAKALAAEQFRAVAPGGWVRTWGFSWDEETGTDVPVPLKEPVEFDRVRIKNMSGPYLETVQVDGGDVEAELWELAYEFHAVEPEQAKVLLAGGMTLDGEGWMNFCGPNYLAFTGEGNGRTATPFYTVSGRHAPLFRDELARALQQAGVGEAVPSAPSEDSLSDHFTADVTGVPEDVLAAAAGWVQAEYEKFLKRTPPSASGKPFVDDWRITNFEGPWTNTADGVTMEVWRVNYEFHEPEPDPNWRAGGMYLTDDGWLCPTYPNCNYPVFTLDGAGQRRFEGVVMQNVYSPDDEAQFNVDQFFGHMPFMLDYDKARAALKAALLGETGFTFYDKEGRPAGLDIESAPQAVFGPSEYKTIWSFAVIDLDGDALLEVVLHVGDVAGDMGGYLVLRWAGEGDVRGYSSYWRNFWDLKDDGTFYYDYYMGITGVARVSFPAPGYVMEQHAVMEGREDMNAQTDPPTGTFTVDGETVTLEEYLAALDKQDEKRDAVWYDFTEENIETALG